jgi:hypothetical protein
LEQQQLLCSLQDQLQIEVGDCAVVQQSQQQKQLQSSHGFGSFGAFWPCLWLAGSAVASQGIQQIAAGAMNSSSCGSKYTAAETAARLWDSFVCSGGFWCCGFQICGPHGSAFSSKHMLLVGACAELWAVQAIHPHWAGVFLQVAHGKLKPGRVYVICMHQPLQVLRLWVHM